MTKTETETETKAETTLKKIPPSIYIGGAACGVAFFVGVAHAMRAHWGEDFHTKTQICGDSVGAIVALQLALGLSSRDIELVAKSIQRKMRLEPHWFEGQNYWLNQYIDYIIQLKPDIHKLMEQRKYQVGTTNMDLLYKWHSSWDSPEALARCVKGSLNVPIYCDHCELVDGEEVMDGAFGFDGSKFPHGNDTLFIGANQAYAEINYNLNLFQLVVPDNQAGFSELFHAGVNAFNQWNGETQDKTGRAMNIYGVYFCWIGKHIQLLYDFIVREIIEK